ncbi:MAG TPA: acetyl-CoA hydrolase/transferase C-terminal domain-containing protein [Xanthomonadales bacterium]|nr:acetyl-CoA hydrolase/transferase C-terminal domain-containing protein [Xanthomonadales bacterium]
MVESQPVVTSSLQECIAFVRQRVGNHWVLGAPLGLGKPNHLINALYMAAKSDPSIRLDLFTALSLNPPKPARGLKQRFLGPFLERQFGDYPRLQYLQDLDLGLVPGNISISEFYFRSGTRMHNLQAQRHYVSSNYTHVARDMQAKGVNIMVQLLAANPQHPGHYSLGSNPDVTLELRRKVPRERLLFLGQLNHDMPYMGGDAELPATEFDLLLNGHPQPLFAVPRMPVGDQDFMIGLHASQLVRDGGTLQLGIGSLGDAVSYFSILRHLDNANYRKLLDSAEADERCGRQLRENWGGDQVFARGLYADSEMFMDGFLHLYQAGVLQRKVYDHCGLQQLVNQGLVAETLAESCLETLWDHGLLPPRLDQPTLLWLSRFGIFRPGVSCDELAISVASNGSVENNLASPGVRNFLRAHALGAKLSGGAILHSAFFLGSKWMYDTLNAMTADERSLFQMTGVSRINQLYGHESMNRAQRLEGRFINTTMKVTLLGAASSDQLDNGQVVSGVGGQYNFVAMAHALERGRSILMLRSHRGSGKRATSNIVWEFPHATIPRHLRDMVVTEYGVADLRSAGDEEVIQKMICIADSRWQEQLRDAAAAAGKLDPAWRIPDTYRRNTPQWLSEQLRPWRDSGVISDYPFGSDFTAEEQLLARALAYLGSRGVTRLERLKLLLAALGPKGKPTLLLSAGLRRMGLEHPASLRELLDQRLVSMALKFTGPVQAFD